jgi:hypothetical protein
MSLSKFKIKKGTNLDPQVTGSNSASGDLEVLQSDAKLHYHNGASDSPMVTEAHAATLTNKVIDADSNTITNIENADIKSGAAIDASKIHDGSVSNTEFGYLDGVSGNLQVQINSKTADASFTAHTGASSGVHGVVGTVVGTSDSQALTNKTIDADSNTITNIENADIKVGAAIDATKIADGSVTSTEFQYLANVSGDLQTQLNSKQTTGNYITALTGDVTATGPGSVSGTISANAVTNSKLAQVATQTFKGRTTASTGNVEDLTTTQATAMLNVMVGDSGSGGTKGLVPAPAAGDAAKFLTGAATYVAASAVQTVVSITNASSPYSASWNTTILVDASSGAVTINFPTASGNSGQKITVKKTDSTFNIVTIDPSGSQTIDGASTTTINTQNESVAVVSNGTNVNIESRTYPMGYIAYTPTFTGFGSPTGVDIVYRRVGAAIEIQGNFTVSSPTGTEARMSLPSGLTTPTRPSLSLTQVGYASVGTGISTNFGNKGVLMEPSTTYVTWGIATSTTGILTKQLGNAVIGSGTIAFFATVPISGWN